MALKMFGVVLMKGMCASSFHPSRCHRAYVAFCLGVLLERAAAALRTRWNQLVWNSSSGEDTCQTQCLSGEDARRSRPPGNVASALVLRTSVGQMCLPNSANCRGPCICKRPGTKHLAMFLAAEVGIDAVTLEARTRLCVTAPLCVADLAIRSDGTVLPCSPSVNVGRRHRNGPTTHSCVAASVKCRWANNSDGPSFHAFAHCRHTLVESGFAPLARMIW